MKRYLSITAAAVLFVLGIVAGSLIGCASPPTKFEQGLFNITTNYGTPVVVVKTNVIPVTLVQTNFLVITNVQGVLEFKTNYLPVFTYQTNTVTVTNTPESYAYAPGAGAKNIQETGGAVGNIFGVGGLVTTALGALFSLWGYVRSSRQYATSSNLAQTIETMREFIKQLPNGATMDNELVNWIQANQANAGVLRNVISLLAAQTSNADARVAAEEIQKTIDALTAQTAQPSTPAKT